MDTFLFSIGSIKDDYKPFTYTFKDVSTFRRSSCRLYVRLNYEYTKVKVEEMHRVIYSYVQYTLHIAVYYSMP